MSAETPKFARAWRSTAIAISLGLLASLVVLSAPHIEALVRRNKSAAGTRFTATETLYDKLDTIAYDYLFQVRGPHNPPRTNSAPGIPEVVIIANDENGSLTVNDLYKRFGSHGPPFPRRVYADLIRKLKQAGAVVVGIDLVFSTRSGYDRSESDPDDDRELEKALKECGNVVLAADFNATTSAKVEFQRQKQDFPYSDEHVNLRTAARAVSPANVTRDNLDNDIRRCWLSLFGPEDPDLPTGDKAYPTFAAQLAALYWKDQVATDASIVGMKNSEFDAYLSRIIQHGDFLNGPLYFHPTDSQTGDDPSSVNICFAGYPGQNSCSVISIGEAVDPKNAAALSSWFRGKIVLIGSWITAEQDFYHTPLLRQSAEQFRSETEQRVAAQQYISESAPRFGVEVHAQAIHTLLAGHFYREFGSARRVALVWLCGLVTALLVARLRPIVSLLPIALLLAAIGMLVAASFQTYVFLRPFQIVLATVLAYGLESVYFYGVENRLARRARSTFQRYVGPRVMERVLDTDFKPGTVEERHLTIMFTDVQGFTSISEKMAPTEVVQTFNRYLNEMVEIIDRHGGTLDKIMGDGVMAYFNAPLPVPHHEQRAVECALEMQAAMRSWRELSESLGLPPLKVRIGINSGDVVFGEVGAKRQLGYTVIGDAVNAAARLEPLNKEFGTEILISEAVLTRLDGTIEAHYVGELAIRGREEGIRAYSVTGRRSIAQTDEQKDP